MEPNDTQVVAPEVKSDTAPQEPAPANPSPEPAPSTESRVKMTDEEEYDMLEGRLKRLGKKLGKDAPKPKAKPKQTDEFDYGQKAYLVAKGHKDNEFDFIMKELESSGLELDQLLESGYFQEKMTKFRNQETVKNATPGAPRTVMTDEKATVDYWVKKGGLPEDRMLARKVVQARLDAERSAFSS